MTSLLETVVSLEMELTNSDVDVRKSALETLSSQLATSSLGSSTSDEVESLLTFYLSKLDDHYSLLPSLLDGLTRMATSERRLTMEQAGRLTSQLLNKVSCQSLTKPDRRRFYHLIDFLIRNHLAALKSLGHDFVFGFIQAVDGEQDPENLVVVFPLAEFVIKNMDISRFTEDFFEVLSCYFPIEFNPPPNDRRGITRADLVRLNRACLLASPTFAPFLLPLLLQKIGSEFQTARSDSLDVLKDGLPIFRVRDVSAFSRSLVDCLLHELQRGADAPYEQRVIGCAVALARVFNDESDTGIRDQFCRDVFETCGPGLDTPAPTHFLSKGQAELALAGPQRVATFLAHLCSAGALICAGLADLLLPLALPNLVTELKEHEYHLQSPASLVAANLLGGLLRRTAMYPGSLEVSAVLSSHLAPLHSHLNSMLHSLTTSHSAERSLMFRLVAGLGLAGPLPEVLPLAGRLLQVVMAAGHCVEIRSEALQVLPDLYMRVAETEGGGACVAQLTSAFDHVESASSREFCLQLVSSLAGRSPTLLSAFLPWLLANLAATDNTVDWGGTVVHLVRGMEVGLSEWTLLVDLVRTRLSSLMGSKDGHCDTLLSLVTRGASTSDQLALLDLCLSTDALSDTSSQIRRSCAVISALNRAASESSSDHTLPYLIKVITSARKQEDESSVILHKLQPACKAYAAVLNKTWVKSDKPLLASIAGSRSGTLFTEHQMHLPPTSGKSGLIWTLWCLRALFAANHMEPALLMLETLLPYPRIGSTLPLAATLANWIGVLLEPAEEALSEAVGACITPLYSQKCQVIVGGRVTKWLQLAEQDSTFDPVVRGHLLAMYVTLTSQLPDHLLKDNLAEILPLLIQALMLGTLECQLAALRLVCNMASPSPGPAKQHKDASLDEQQGPNVVLTGYAEDILGVVFKLLASEKWKMLSPEQRVVVCRTLVRIARLSAPLVARYRSDVMRALDAVKNDSKRVVRVEATVAHNLWTVLC